MRGTISRPTSPSICCRRSMKLPMAGCDMISTAATRRSAGGRSKAWTSSFTRMSELEIQIGRFLAELARAQASPHTLHGYGSDLRQFLKYFTPPEGQPPPLARFGVLEVREWLGGAYKRNLG